MPTAKERLREFIRTAARNAGYEITRRSSAPLGASKYADLAQLLVGNPRPVIFDVGSNVGLTVQAYKKLFPGALIHAFEPSPEVFAELQRRMVGTEGLSLNELALGSQIEERTFLENSETHMSSFLPPDQECWGAVVKQTKVKLSTLDNYCAQHGIRLIDLLKVDAQGFDLEVLKGGTESMRAGVIPLLLIEITFARHYQNAPSFGELYGWLLDHKYRLMTMYEIQYRDGLAAWCDALFIHESRRHEREPKR